MHTKTVKANACITATADSRINRGIKINVEIKWKKIKKIFPKETKAQEKPAITFSKVWPAMTLTNSHIAKLTGLKMYRINSIGTSRKARIIWVLSGRNKPNILNWCCRKQIIFSPINKYKLNDNNNNRMTCYSVTIRN